MHRSLRTPRRVFFSLATLLDLIAYPARAVDTYAENPASEGDGE